jgi:hypothetical protein
MYTHGELLYRLRSLQRTVANIESLIVWVGAESQLFLLEHDDSELRAECKALDLEISKFACSTKALLNQGVARNLTSVSH